MDNSYNVRTDEYFKDYIRVSGITEGTTDKYAFELNKLCKANNMEFSEFVDKCKYEQSYVKEIPANREDNGTNEYFRIKFDVNNPKNLIKKGLNAYVDYCKERGNHNTNINNSMACIRGILNHCDIELPKWRPLEDDAEDWELLEKEDFLFVLNDCSLNHKSLITFMLSSGIRLGDCLNLTIGDFMEATSDFHDFVDVDEFIDNAPQDMLGYWDFMPNKTKKHKIQCKTMNSKESSNYILQNLRRVKNDYLPKKSKEIDEELKMSKNDALFGSRHKLYKGKITVAGISEQFRLKNKKLREWHINKIKQDIEKGNISEEDFDKKVSKIPKFHAHACRKYFQSTVSDYCGNLRVCAMMEGHAPPLKNDKSYIKINKDKIKETYDGKLLEALTLENIKVKTFTSEEAEKLRKKTEMLEETVASLLASNENKDKIIQELENSAGSSSNDVIKLLKEKENLPKLERFDNEEVDSELHSDIRMYIRELILADFHHEHFGEEYPFDIHVNGEDELVITELTYDIIANDKNIYDGTKESLDKVITKAKLKLKLNPEYKEKVDMEYKILENEENTLIRISKVIMNKVKEMKLIDDDKELNMFYSDVLEYVSQNTFSFMGRFLEDDEIIEVINIITG